MNYDHFWKTISQKDLKDAIESVKQAQENVKKSKETDLYKMFGETFETLFEDLTKAFEEAQEEVKVKDTERVKGFSEKTGKIEVPMAGYNRADIKVALEGDVVVITNTNDQKAPKTLKYRIPGEIESLALSMKDGLLTIEVKRPVAKSQTITWVG